MRQSIALVTWLCLANVASASNGLDGPSLTQVKECMTAVIAQDSTLVSWDSRAFRPVIVGSSEHLARVFDLAKHHAPEIRAYIASFAGEGALLQSPEVWNRYVRAYDKAIAVSAGYVALMRHFHRVLPRSGQLADFGCATATIPLMLTQSAPSRNFSLFDFSSIGLLLAQRKVDYILPRLSAPVPTIQIHQQDVTKLNWSLVPRLNGVMINNFVYTLPPKDQEVVMAHIADKLEKDGVIAIAELNGDEITTPEKLLAVSEQVTQSAILNGAQLTEFEIAYLVHVNREMVTNRLPPYLTEARHHALAAHGGLKIRSIEKVFYDGSLFVVYEKP